ncbi:MAG TPA: hypothetical protein VG326_20935 [Tepidisphaeraceae bacterium]|jgi:hypothetical protein|nr:hypothetical protein [Tepidisphaeraceae bacterium]
MRGIWLSGLIGGRTRVRPPSVGAGSPNRVWTAASIAAPRHITHGSSVDTRRKSRASVGALPAARLKATISACAVLFCEEFVVAAR